MSLLKNHMSLDISVKNEGRYRLPNCSYCKEKITQGQPVQFYQMSDDVLRPLHTGCATGQDVSSNKPSIDSLLETAGNYSQDIGIMEERLGHLKFCLDKIPIAIASLLPSARTDYFLGSGQSSNKEAVELGIFDLFQVCAGISLIVELSTGENYGWTAATYMLISGVKAIAYKSIFKNTVKKTEDAITDKKDILSRLHEQIKGTSTEEVISEELIQEKVIRASDKKSLSD